MEITEKREFDNGYTEGQADAGRDLKRGKARLIAEIQPYSRPDIHAMIELEKIADRTDFYSMGYTKGYNSVIIEHFKKTTVLKVVK